MTATTLPGLPRLARFWYRVDAMRHRRGLQPIHAANLIDPGEPSCAACGWRVPEAVDDDATFDDVWRTAGRWLDRAHLVDRVAGGPDRVANLIPLCHPCHRRMPPCRSKADALAWIAEQPYRPAWWQLVTAADSPASPTDRHDLRRLWQALSLEVAAGRYTVVAGGWFVVPRDLLPGRAADTLRTPAPPPFGVGPGVEP